MAQNSSFTKVYSGTDADNAVEMVQLSNGDYFILANTSSYGSGNTDMMVMRTNSLGEVTWSYAYGTGGNDTATSLTLTSDGGLLVTGYSDSVGIGIANGLVMKLTSSGAISWARVVDNDSFTTINDAVEARTGGYFIVGTMYLDSLDKNIFVSNVSTTGNFFWTKTYGGIKDDIGVNIGQDLGGKLIVTGTTSNDSTIAGASGDVDIQVYRMETSGKVLWNSTYGTMSNEAPTSLTIKGYDYYMTGYTEGGDFPGRSMLLFAIDSGKSQNINKTYLSAGRDVSTSMTIRSSGDLSLVGTLGSPLGTDNIAFLNLDNSGSIVLADIIGGDSVDGQGPSWVMPSVESGVVILGSGKSLISSTSSDLYLLKTENDNSIGCGNVFDMISEGGVTFSSASHPYSTNSGGGAVLTLKRTSISGTDSTLCCQLEARVSSDSIFMCEGDKVRLGAGSASGYIYRWTEEGGNWTSSASNPTVSPENSTTYKLVVSESTGECAKDSAYVYVTVNARISVDFARDSFFCEGGSVEITAYPNMNSYTWTGDGYTYGGQKATFSKGDSVILTVIDQNSCIYKDSILITEIPTPVFELGRDTTICTNLALTLEGPDDMEFYIWNGVSTNSQTLKVSKQNIYRLEVIDSFGCRFKDSLVVNTKPHSTFDLGPDTSICPGASFTIVGPGALNSFVWNDTASQSADLIVNKGGTYHLTAKNSFSCPYSDTIVISEYALPVFDLGGTKEFCEGGIVVVQGPSNHTSYTWSHGGDKDTAHLRAGEFWLEVVDVNGCSFRDSLTVIENPNPVITLGSDTVICKGHTIVLSPGTGFDEYLWSTQETTSSIVVDKKGTYSVTVLDAKGCEGSASINVDTTTCTGIEYLGNVEVSIYPNPVENILLIESTSSLMGGKLILSDIYGKAVLVKDVQSHDVQLDLSTLNNGTYILQIFKDNNSLSTRVIVNR